MFNQHNKEEHRPSHTVEHLLNGVISRKWKCGRAVNAHIERKKSKLDYLLNFEPNDKEVKEIEDEVNRIIALDIPVVTEVISLEEASKKFDCSKLPKDVSQKVRIVKIGEYDSCLCVGDHVKNTSEIKEVNFVSHSYNNNIWRLRFKVIPKEN